MTCSHQCCICYVSSFATHLWKGRLSATWETCRYCTWWMWQRSTWPDFPTRRKCSQLSSKTSPAPTTDTDKERFKKSEAWLLFCHTKSDKSILGSLEFSNGSAYIAPYYFEYPQVLAILSAILAFGGFCVFFQSAHILSGTPLSLGVYLTSKIVQAIFAYLLTVILYPVYMNITTASNLAINYNIVAITILLFVIIGMTLKIISVKLPLKTNHQLPV